MENGITLTRMKKKMKSQMINRHPINFLGNEFYGLKMKILLKQFVLTFQVIFFYFKINMAIKLCWQS